MRFHRQIISVEEALNRLLAAPGGKGKQAGDVVEVIPHAAASWM